MEETAAHNLIRSALDGHGTSFATPQHPPCQGIGPAGTRYPRPPVTPKRREPPRDDASHQPLQPTFHPSIHQTPDSQASGFRLPTVATPAHQTHAFARARLAITLDDAEGPFPAPQPWVEVGLTPCHQLLPVSPPLWAAGSPTTTRVSLLSPHEPDERTTGTHFHPKLMIGTRTPFHGPLVKADRFPKPGVPSIERSRLASSGFRPKLALRAATGTLAFTPRAQLPTRVHGTCPLDTKSVPAIRRSLGATCRLSTSAIEQSVNTPPNASDSARVDSKPSTAPTAPLRE